MMRKRGVPVFVELLRAKGSRESEARHGERAIASPVPVSTPAAAPGSGFETPAIASTPPLRLAGAGQVGNGEGAGTRSGVAISPPPVVRAIPRQAGTVEPKAVAPANASPIDDASSGPTFGGISRSGWLWIAGGVLALVVVWYLAYSLGHGDGEKKSTDAVSKILDQDRSRVAERSGEQRVPGNDVQTNGTREGEPQVKNGQPAAGSREKPPEPKPIPAPAPTTSDKLTAGHNYLIVATLMKKDAEEAAKYLSENGVGVTVFPSGGIDPADPKVNNPQQQWQVAVLKGFAPADYRRTESDRLALVDQVQRLGRKWKATNKKAPTDFSQVFWQKYKGP